MPTNRGLKCCLFIINLNRLKSYIIVIPTHYDVKLNNRKLFSVNNIVMINLFLNELRIFLLLVAYFKIRFIAQQNV